MEYPNLHNALTDKDVITKSGGSYAAEYVPWAKVMHTLHEKAPGWLPFMKLYAASEDADGSPLWPAPNGSAFLMIGFRHEGSVGVTEVVPHAIMDSRNNAMPMDRIDSRDISDAYVRGVCKAAALCFGLGWQLWSKADPMARDGGESDAKPEPKPPQKQPQASPQSDRDKAAEFKRECAKVMEPFEWDDLGERIRVFFESVPPDQHEALGRSTLAKQWSKGKAKALQKAGKVQ